MNDEREVISAEDAISRIGDGEYIHTFLNPAPGVMVGADWPRAEVIAALQKYEVELSGENATGMRHGICFNDGKRWVFVEVKQ